MLRLTYPSGPVEGADGYGPTGSNAGAVSFGGWLWVWWLEGFSWEFMDHLTYKSTFNWLAGCFGLSKSGWGLLTILGDLKNLFVRYRVFGIHMSYDDSFQIGHQISWDKPLVEIFENCKVGKEVRWSPFYKLTAGTPPKIGDLYMFFPISKGFPMLVFGAYLNHSTCRWSDFTKS